MLVGINAARSPSLSDRDQQPRGFLGLLESFAVAAPGHAERIIQQHHQRDGAAAGEKTGAGLEDRIGKQQRRAKSLPGF